MAGGIDELALPPSRMSRDYGTRVRCWPENEVVEAEGKYSLKPARYQATTVSGCTITSVRFHPGQNRRKYHPKDPVRSQ